MRDRWLPHSILCAGVALLVGFGSSSIPATAEAAEEPFFKGKTMRIIIGFSPGGGVDLRARLFARHMAKYIPGKPNIIVQNMTGAGGIVGANYALGGVAKPDGLTLMHFPSSTIMNAFLLKGRVKYDIRKTPILWVQSDIWVTIANPKTANLRTAADLVRSPMKLAIGGTGVSSLRTLRPKLALDLLGVDHQWVTGYSGSARLMAAMDRGEIHIAEQSIGGGYAQLIQPREKDGTVVILFQTGVLKPDGSFERSAAIPNVPALSEMLPQEKKTGAAWEAWKAATLPSQAFQTAVGLPAGVPSERVAILRRAVKLVTEDPQFQADHEKTLGEPVHAITGEEAAKVVDPALKQLFEDYSAGVEYLRQMPQQR